MHKPLWAALAVLAALLCRSLDASALAYPGAPEEKAASVLATIPCNTDTTQGVRYRVVHADSGSCTTAGTETNTCVCDGTDWVVEGNGSSAEVPDAKYQNGGCADAIGCAAPDGGMYLISSHLWDSSPGVWDSPTGQLFSTGAAVVASRYDSIATVASDVHTVQNGAACAVSYATGDSGVHWCTSITGMVSDSDEIEFCRRTSSPFATCNDNAGTCGSSISGADDPTPIIVKNAANKYTPMMVTAYGGCTGGANTLTVQPFPYDDAIVGDGTDTWKPAMRDAIHTSDYHGAYEAQNLLTAIQETEYVPHKNMAAAYNTDLVGDCTAWTTAGVTPALVAYDPTKAAWLGSYSAVRGQACKLDNAANGDAIVSPAITVEAGTSYQMRIRMGSSGMGAAPTIELIDQAGTAIVSGMRVITRGEVVDYLAQGVHYLDQNQLGGWATVAFRFTTSTPATPVAQTVRIRVYTGSNGVSPTNQFYTDDWQMWPSLDGDALVAADVAPWKTVIPNGARGTFRMYSDSRGLVGYGDITAALDTLKTSLRPDLSGLTFVRDAVGSRVVDSALTITARNTYVGFRLGVVDAFFGYQSVLPLAYDMTAASNYVRGLGAKTIWFEELPVAGNSAFSSLSPSCREADLTTPLSCAKFMEQLTRTLIRSGSLN